MWNAYGGKRNAAGSLHFAITHTPHPNTTKQRGLCSKTGGPFDFKAPGTDEVNRGECARFPSIDRFHDHVDLHDLSTCTLDYRIFNNRYSASPEMILTVLHSALVS